MATGVKAEEQRLFVSRGELSSEKQAVSSTPVTGVCRLHHQEPGSHVRLAHFLPEEQLPGFLLAQAAAGTTEIQGPTGPGASAQVTLGRWAPAGPFPPVPANGAWTIQNTGSPLHFFSSPCPLSCVLFYFCFRGNLIPSPF